MKRSDEFTDYLLNKLNLSRNYKDTWSEGGSYGTCWDTDGPTELSVEAEIDYDTFSEYHTTLKIIFKGLSLPKKVDYDTYETYSNLLWTDSESESDYYGGCSETGTISFNTADLINAVLHKTYGFSNVTIEDAKYNIPEIFL